MRGLGAVVGVAVGAASGCVPELHARPFVAWRSETRVELPARPAAAAPGDPGFTPEEWAKLASLAGLGAPPTDPSNRVSGDARAARLGKKLYFDEAFSGVSTHVDTLGRVTPLGRSPKGELAHLSCATCHDPRKAGASADVLSPMGLAVGAGLYDVTVQTTFNAAFHSTFYWNGRNDSLWSQALAVAESPVSMAGNRTRIAHRMAEAYRAEYEAVFTDPLPEASSRTGVPTPHDGRPGAIPGCQKGDPREPFGDAFDCMAKSDQNRITRVFVNFGKAIAAYEARLVSRDSAFDRFVAEGPRSTLLSESARRGARLFVGKAGCVECHSTPLLSDGKFYNIGAPSNPSAPVETDCPKGGKCDCDAGKNCLPWGALDGGKKLALNPFRRDSEWSDARDEPVREPIPRPRGAYRTPSLRDVALTAPYMHNGIYDSLREVLRHYSYGGRITTGPIVGEVTDKLKIIELGRTEERDVVAFLETLTGAPLPEELVRPD